jgi:hypothetical protein
MGTLIPPDLPTDVEKWTTEHTLRFLEAIKEEYELKDEHLQIFGREDINGQNLLVLQADQLCHVGLPFGPANRIIFAIEDLKKVRGLVKTGK